MEKNMEKNCPRCDRNCPVEQLHCNRGREHFGQPLQEERGGHGGHGGHGHGEGRPEEKMIMLLRRCGHFLHHNVGRDADLSALTKALSPEERAELERLLEKCLSAWDR